MENTQKLPNQLGILTEEELKKIVSSISKDGVAEKVNTIVSSHRTIQERNRNLVLENDEQTAEIEKLKQAVKKVKDHLEGVMNPRRFVILDGPMVLQTLSQALEETK